MNGGLFPGLQLNGEQLGANSVGMEVVTASGSYVTKADNFEITLIGGGANGSTQNAGGDSGASLIKRIVGLPPGTTLTCVIGAAGSAGGTSTCLIPGFGQLTANGGAGASGSSGTQATATGGDININGQIGTALDQNGSGGVGGSTLFGLGGGPGGNGQSGSGFGSGGGSAVTAGHQSGIGQPGVMVVRYF